MKEVKKERRNYQRYNTEMKVYFKVNYDIRTKVRFQVLSPERPKRNTRKHSGLTENINAEGLRFVSHYKLKKDDAILLEVYIPSAATPILMQGSVRWSRKIGRKEENCSTFHTGVRIISVCGKPISDTVHFDQDYNVVWSRVLESVFGSFKTLVRRRRRKKAAIKKTA